VTMQETTRAEAVAQAWRRIVRSGDAPSVRRVRDELLRSGVGGSLRDLAPMVARLRVEALDDPRIGEVVRLYRSLSPLARREALRMIRELEERR
jgi:hypothetical protein